MTSTAYSFGDLPRERVFGEALIRGYSDTKHVSYLESWPGDSEFIGSSEEKPRLPFAPISVVRGRSHCVYRPQHNAQGGTISSSLQGLDILYGGFFFPHYGHFITETLCRLWKTDYSTDTVVLMSTATGDDTKTIMTLEDLPAFSQTILLACGIKDVRVLGSYPSDVRSATIPWPLMQTRYSIHPDYCNMLSTIGRSILNGNKNSNTEVGLNSTNASTSRVYLARNRLSSCLRPLLNEEDVQEVFILHGFKVIHPETMPLSMQIRILETADVIAGFAGSALHTVAFTSKPKALIALCCETKINSNFMLFSGPREDKCTAVFLDSRKFPRSVGRTPDFEVSPPAIAYLAKNLNLFLPQ